MATETALRLGRIENPIEIEARKARPVVWFAGFGFVAVVFCLWLYGTYLYDVLRGAIKTVPTGPTPVPEFMYWSARINEWVGFVVVTWFFYHFVYRPWKRERRFTWDGMFLVASVGVLWQDLAANFTQIYLVENAVLFNWGSWYSRIPGWVSPEGRHLLETPYAGTWYTFGMLGVAIPCCYLMRRFKTRYPRTGSLGLFGVLFVVICALDLVMEGLYVRMGLYVYAGAASWESIWPGHYYQFPLHETLFWGITWSAFISLRYFRNDKGETVCERGISDLRVGTKTRAVIRLLAIWGALNAIFLVCYTIPAQLFSLHSEEWPEDIQKRSYFTQELCGEATGIACPSPAIPINREDSVRVTPEGNISIPSGTEPPTAVPFDRECPGTGWLEACRPVSAGSARVGVAPGFDN